MPKPKELHGATWHTRTEVGFPVVRTPPPTPRVRIRIACPKYTLRAEILTIRRHWMGLLFHMFLNFYTGNGIRVATTGLLPHLPLPFRG